jgi:coenzyme F420-reducing hydrogenase beta subunit
MPSSPEAISPKQVISSGLCIGCGSCVGQLAGGDAKMALNRYGQFEPRGSQAWLNRKSQAMAQICPFSPRATDEDHLAEVRFPTAPSLDARLGRFEENYVGAVAEEDYRANGSSGGMVTWVAAELLRQGLVDGVAHVGPTPDSDGFFGYRISRTLSELRSGAKSRYYPVELSGVIETIRNEQGRYAVVGIPCFIKAINLLRQTDPVLQERITHTLGLFCGHMKSARLVESFAWQLGVDIDAVAQPEYRLKNPERPANWYTAHLALKDGTTRQQDWWHLCDGDWGAGFFMSSACNFCDDVMAETADIAFGDAWVEPYSSDGRGTNVVIVRSPQLHGLVESAMAHGRLELEAVDAEFIAQTQAAGLRQRREGLAYRLTWLRAGLRPRKRVKPSNALPLRRKAIYRTRYGISAWSHRVFWAARKLQKPNIYIRWGHQALSAYQGLTYGRGWIGKLVSRLGLSGRDG